MSGVFSRFSLSPARLGVLAAAVALLAGVAALYFPSDRDLLFPNSDFERGNLTNWTASGNAFAFQPTYGHNVFYRGGGYVHEIGKYWIGTYEKRPNETGPRGYAALQGDGPTGELVSVPFVVRGDRISFYVGGGDGTTKTCVAFQVDGQRPLVAVGNAAVTGNEDMRRVTWDVSRWKGRQANVVIVDASSGGWGHVNADDFRYR